MKSLICLAVVAVATPAAAQVSIGSPSTNPQVLASRVAVGEGLTPAARMGVLMASMRPQPAPMVIQVAEAAPATAAKPVVAQAKPVDGARPAPRKPD